MTRTLWLGVVSAFFLVAACKGDPGRDGRDGDPGPPGIAGMTGMAGPPGPPGAYGFLPDPYFEQGGTYWILDPAEVRTVGFAADAGASAPPGRLHLENAPGAVTTVLSRSFVPADASRQYELSAAVWSAGDAPAGSVTALVRYFDDERIFLREQVLARWTLGTVWSRAYTRFGASTDLPVPADARFFTAGVRLNDVGEDAPVAGTEVHAVTGLMLHSVPTVQNPLLRDGCTDPTVTTIGPWHPIQHAFTLDRARIVTIHARVATTGEYDPLGLSSATRSASLHLAATENAPNLDSAEGKAPVGDRVNLPLLWTGLLAPGDYTATIRTEPKMGLDCMRSRVTVSFGEAAQVPRVDAAFRP